MAEFLSTEREYKRSAVVRQPDGGDGKTGRIVGPETRKALSEARRRWVAENKELNYLILAKARERLKEPEVRAKIAKANKERGCDAEWGRRAVSFLWGDPAAREKELERRRSPEARHKLSEAMTGKECSASHREAIRQSRIGKSLSTAAKAKLSMAFKGREFSEETRQRLSEAWERRRRNPEQMLKLSVAAKEREARKRIAKEKVDGLS